MAIFFNCSCGQDLRAEETQERQKKECPACGLLVSIPSLAAANQRLGIEPSPPSYPDHSQAEASASIPVMPWHRPAQDESSQSADESPPTPYPVTPNDENDANNVWQDLERREILRLTREARKALRATQGGRSWQLETSWLKCLLYPVLRAWPILAGLALVWTTVAALIVHIVAALGDEDKQTALIPLLLPVVFLGGYSFAFFRCVLASATAGEAGFVRWPGFDMPQVLWSMAATVGCFVAGPVIPVVLACFFWLNAGDLAWVDVLILWELGFAAVAYWTLALMAVDRSGRLRDANPAALVRMAGRLKWRARLVVLLAAAGVVAAFELTLEALELVHEDAAGALGLCWWAFWGLAWLVFLLRWLGVSEFHAKEAERRDLEMSQDINLRKGSTLVSSK